VTDEDRRREQLAKLDEIERRAEELMERPRFHVHAGSPVLDPRTGEPLRDEEPPLRGMDAQLGVLRLRAKILGYDAPQKHHLVDEKGNTIDITRLVPLLGMLGITDEADDD
jgi:hypothetical protein